MSNVARCYFRETIKGREYCSCPESKVDKDQPLGRLVFRCTPACCIHYSDEPREELPGQLSFKDFI